MLFAIVMRLGRDKLTTIITTPVRGPNGSGAMAFQENR
jgi:hypothetical protein